MKSSYARRQFGLSRIMTVLCAAVLMTSGFVSSAYSASLAQARRAAYQRRQEQGGPARRFAAIRNIKDPHKQYEEYSKFMDELGDKVTPQQLRGFQRFEQSYKRIRGARPGVLRTRVAPAVVELPAGTLTRKQMDGYVRGVISKAQAIKKDPAVFSFLRSPATSTDDWWRRHAADDVAALSDALQAHKATSKPLELLFNAFWKSGQTRYMTNRAEMETTLAGPDGKPASEQQVKDEANFWLLFHLVDKKPADRKRVVEASMNLFSTIVKRLRSARLVDRLEKAAQQINTKVDVRRVLNVPQAGVKDILSPEGSAAIRSALPEADRQLIDQMIQVSRDFETNRRELGAAAQSLVAEGYRPAVPGMEEAPPTEEAYVAPTMPEKKKGISKLKVAMFTGALLAVVAGGAALYTFKQVKDDPANKGKSIPELVKLMPTQAGANLATGRDKLKAFFNSLKDVFGINPGDFLRKAKGMMPARFRGTGGEPVEGGAGGGEGEAGSGEAE